MKLFWITKFYRNKFILVLCMLFEIYLLGGWTQLYYYCIFWINVSKSAAMPVKQGNIKRKMIHKSKGWTKIHDKYTRRAITLELALIYNLIPVSGSHLFSGDFAGSCSTTLFSSHIISVDNIIGLTCSK